MFVKQKLISKNNRNWWKSDDLKAKKNKNCWCDCMKKIKYYLCEFKRKKDNKVFFEFSYKKEDCELFVMDYSC